MRDALAAGGAIPPLVLLLESEPAAVQERAAVVLWKLSWEGDCSTGQPDADRAQLIVSAGAMPRLLEMTQIPHLKALALAVMVNLAINTQARAELRRTGMVELLAPRIMELLLSAGEVEHTSSTTGADWSGRLITRWLGTAGQLSCSCKALCVCKTGQ